MTDEVERTFIAIPRDVIAADTATGVDLYVRVGPRYLLYRSGRERVDARSLAKLRRRAVETLYIDVGEVLRDTVQTSLQNAFQALDDSATIQRVRDASDATVKRIANDNQLVPHLIRFAVGDGRLYSHSINTAAYAVALASRRDELDEEQLRMIGIGALAHDVGLANADPDLLGREESALTDGERAFLAQHPQRGAGLLLDTSITNPMILEIVSDHHVSAPDLPLHLQIVQLADAFDTLTSRPGRTDTGTYRALYTLRETMRGRYRPDLLRDFIAMLGSLELPDEGVLTPLPPPPPLEAAKPAFRSPAA